MCLSDEYFPRHEQLDWAVRLVLTFCMILLNSFTSLEERCVLDDPLAHPLAHFTLIVLTSTAVCFSGDDGKELFYDWEPLSLALPYAFTLRVLVMGITLSFLCQLVFLDPLS